MNLIGREELKEKLDHGETFKLIMALDDWQYRAKHIPGSIPASALTGLEMSKMADQKEVSHAIQKILTQLKYDDEIIVYCSHVSCVGSIFAYQALDKAGFKKLRRYAGGVADWEDAGYPLEGELVN